MVRGASRGGRGMPGRAGMGRPPFNRPRVLMLRPPFDLILAEPSFPRCKPAPDDSALTQALLKRHAELCPTPAEQSAVLSLVTKLQTVLDNLVVAPGDFAACVSDEFSFKILLVRERSLDGKISYSDTDADPHNATRGFFYSHVGWLLVKRHEEVRRREKLIDMSDIYDNPVLTFQKNWLKSRQNQASRFKLSEFIDASRICTCDHQNITFEDIMRESLNAGPKFQVMEELNKLMRAEGLGNVTSTCHERGFTVSTGAAGVRGLVTTLHQNLRKLEPDVHLDYKIISSHLAAIRHSRWFEENAHHSSIKVLIRLLRDMCARHAGLEPLSPWMIDLLAHHCIMNNPARQALPINVAFRRALSLLAGGLFLPGCAGLPDPCEAAHSRAHTALDLAAQDHAAATAQTLLRVVARGGHRYVLGLQAFEGGKDISTEITVWDGVVVSPLAPAYHDTPEPMDTDDKADGSSFCDDEEGVQDGVAA
nr:interleukin enhancer-binding factor 2 homolog [Danaus plexippus plexippus]